MLAKLTLAYVAAILLYSTGIPISHTVPLKFVLISGVVALGPAFAVVLIAMHWFEKYGADKSGKEEQFAALMLWTTLHFSAAMTIMFAFRDQYPPAEIFVIGLILVAAGIGFTFAYAKGFWSQRV